MRRAPSWTKSTDGSGSAPSQAHEGGKRRSGLQAQIHRIMRRSGVARPNCWAGRAYHTSPPSPESRMKAYLARQLRHALAHLIADRDISDDFDPAAFDVEFQMPARPEHGDLATNAALQLARPLKQNPRKIAEALVDALDVDPDRVAAVEIAGPGFINFRFADAYLARGVADVLAQGADYGRTDEGAGRTAIVEYVSANPTGPLTVGTRPQRRARGHRRQPARLDRLRRHARVLLQRRRPPDAHPRRERPRALRAPGSSRHGDEDAWHRRRRGDSARDVPRRRLSRRLHHRHRARPLRRARRRAHGRRPLRRHGPVPAGRAGRHLRRHRSVDAAARHRDGHLFQRALALRLRRRVARRRAAARAGPRLRQRRRRLVQDGPARQDRHDEGERRGRGKRRGARQVLRRADVPPPRHRLSPRQAEPRLRPDRGRVRRGSYRDLSRRACAASKRSAATRRRSTC